jgi:hypothetical protein
MRELLIILLVIAVLIALTAFRYRKQILAFYKFWSAFRAIQQKHAQTQMTETIDDASGPLVNCAKCGAWTSESSAIRLGARTFYCSAACMEKAATAA